MRHAHRTIPFITIAAVGCLTRPVTSGAPETKTNFTRDVTQNAIDKVDLLFAIDNSASMGDKQEYLSQAIPDLIARLITPNCVDAQGKVTGVSHDDGACDAGTVEYKPVHDLHIGIVSSALGPRLGDQAPFTFPNGKPAGVCDPSASDSVTGRSLHEDDRGHLLTRAGDDEHPLGAASPGFLAWFPAVKENAGRTPPAVAVGKASDLVADFQALVAGVHQQGCGIESQLESWYRFLIQPDPYDHLAVDGGKATWQGVDTTILAQRRDFLRPDSLVAVVVLSDENDSEVDATSLEGHGFWFMNQAFAPPRGTAACATNPLDPGCMSCSVPAAQGDPGCAVNGGSYTSRTDWGYDMNLRHVHMRQKYGVDPQFPIDRYVNGLTQPTVPDRTRADSGCTNPLFAAALPDGSSTDAKSLCQLPAGTRASDLVFYAHIGGVPHELLHFTPGDSTASALTDADWVKILGQDPEGYDLRGIDPHMIESSQPRPGLPGPGEANDADPISGREWITDQGGHSDLAVDLQYACTFPLATARDCADPTNKPGCDCSPPLYEQSLTPEQTSPVCDANTPTRQVRAKAYPTIRETLLAKKLGKQGIVSSICPIHVTESQPGDPLYGYRPAVAAIVDRLKSKLAVQCLPRKLDVQADGTVKCLVLATLPSDAGSACDPALGMSPPDSTVLAIFRKQQHDEWAASGSRGPDPSTRAVCAIRQLVGADLVQGTCRASTKPGWCYAEGKAAASDLCDQELQFTSGTPPSGVKVSLQCIEEAPAPP